MKGNGEEKPMSEKNTENVVAVPRTTNFENTNMLPLPVANNRPRRSSVVAFNLPDIQGRGEVEERRQSREELGEKRHSIVSFLSSFHSSSSRHSIISSALSSCKSRSMVSSRMSITTMEFKRTVHGMGILIFLVFTLVILVVVFLFWGHIMNLTNSAQEDGGN